MSPEKIASEASLQDEILRLREENHAQRTALVNAHLTLHAIAEQCQEILKQSVPSDSCHHQLQRIVNQVISDDNSSWLSELRVDAFRRGFSEGYVYAKTSNTTFANASEALKNAELKLRAWPIHHNTLSRHFNQKRPEPLLLRYELIPDPDALFARDSEFGELVHAEDYLDLKYRFDMLREELLGLKLVLRDPFSVSANTGADLKKHCKNRLRVSGKPGQIRAQFGNNKGEYDFFVFWGPNVPHCDRALVMYHFNTKPMHFDYEQNKPVFGASFLDELKQRGFDLSTLRFTVSKNIENSALQNAYSTS